ncbi:MAG: hypothetical protein M3Y30_03485 [Gemmatimonadota bacterium]|nr:hypothetical protein [Gemmatimonadota bacterium]
MALQEPEHEATLERADEREIVDEQQSRAKWEHALERGIEITAFAAQAAFACAVAHERRARGSGGRVTHVVHALAWTAPRAEPVNRACIWAEQPRGTPEEGAFS